jgi:hypothetical protein
LAVVGAIVAIVELRGWKRWALVSLFVLLGIGEWAVLIKNDRKVRNDVRSQQAAMEQFQNNVQRWQEDVGGKLDALSKQAPPSQQQAIAKLRHEIMVPKLSMETGITMNPQYAFETRFILSNHGPLEVSDATYLCEVPGADEGTMLHLNFPIRIAPTASGPIGTLGPDKQHSIYCDFTMSLTVNTLNPVFAKIWVFYIYGKKPGKQGFQFLAMRKQDGTYAWEPRGEAKDMVP